MQGSTKRWQKLRKAQALGLNTATFEVEEKFQDDARRHDEAVLEELERWWFLTNGDGSSVVDYEEYKLFYHRLAYAVRGEGNKLEGASLMQAMEADWRHDSRGKHFIIHRDFFDSIYEMAVTWSLPEKEHEDDPDQELTSAELVKFLKDLALRLFGTDSSVIQAWWASQMDPKSMAAAGFLDGR
jgi:hypothetical protein